MRSLDEVDVMVRKLVPVVMLLGFVPQEDADAIVGESLYSMDYDDWCLVRSTAYRRGIWCVWNSEMQYGWTCAGGEV